MENLSPQMNGFTALAMPQLDYHTSISPYAPGSSPLEQYISYQNSVASTQSPGMIMNDLSLFPQQRYWSYASDPNSLFGVLGEDNTMQSEAAKQENNPEDAREAQRTLRRREQNREDQRRYRARKENAIRTVTDELVRSREQLEKAKQHNSLLMKQWKILEARIAQLEEENLALKSMSPTQSLQSWDDSLEDMSQTNNEQWYTMEASGHPFSHCIMNDK